MTVWHLNTSIVGGAAIAARRIHESVKLSGCRSKFFHLGTERIGTDVDTLPGLARNSKFTSVAERLRVEWLRRRWRPAPAFDFYLLPWPGTALPREVSTENSTILHFHWMQGWLNYRALGKKGAKVVLTLHDMNAFTGGCIYGWECGRHVQGCGECPQLLGRSAADLSRRVAKRKADFWRSLEVHVVAPSRWMIEQARRSAALKNAASFTHIPYGLDLEAFHPLSKPLARQALGWDEGIPTVLFGAASGSSDRRKGYDLLVQALHLLKPDSLVRLLTFGHSEPHGELPPSVQLIHLGQLSSDRVQALVYSAADVTVVPSLQDNSPQVILESFACGTPVLGTNVGGIPELIVPGETGCLASATSESLAAKMVELIQDRKHLLYQGARAREYVERNHTLERQGRAYCSLYADVLGAAPKQDKAAA
jgi:glycosyltransferase involved in cell wall biosynthesis